MAGSLEGRGSADLRLIEKEEQTPPRSAPKRRSEMRSKSIDFGSAPERGTPQKPGTFAKYQRNPREFRFEFV